MKKAGTKSNLSFLELPGESLYRFTYFEPHEPRLPFLYVENLADT